MTTSAHSGGGISAHAALVGSAACFGSATAMSKYALNTLSAADLLLIEIAGTAALLGALVRWRGRLVTVGWRFYVLLGAVEPAATYLLANLGLARTSASRGALLLSLETAFGVTAAALVARERISVGAGLALVGGLGGAVSIGAESTGDRASFTGDVLVLAAAAAAGGYGVLARRLPHRDDPLTVTAVQYLAATILVLPYVGISWITSGSHLLSAPRPIWAAAVGTAAIGSAAAFVLFNYAIAQVPAGRAALLLGLTPLFGVAAAAAGLHETVTVRQILGGLLILSGLAALGWPGRRRSASPRPRQESRIQRPGATSPQVAETQHGSSGTG
jgi:drug/metabolite transporter (DMT)-like permease